MDVLFAGLILYLQFANHGVITLDFRTTTVTVTSTVNLIQAPYADVNITSVDCSTFNRSCTISVLNYGDMEVRFAACIFQPGGLGTLNATAGLSAHTQTGVKCLAPAEMTGVAAGARVLGALFFVRSSPLIWSGVWQ